MQENITSTAKKSPNISKIREYVILFMIIFVIFGLAVIIRSFASSRIKVNAPAVAVARAAENNNAYWIATSDGGVFSFGGARFFGSMGDKRLDQPITSMAARPQKDGYWLLGGDCGVFSFGNSRYHGKFDQNAQNFCKAIISTPSGNGYWLISRYGNIFKYGDAENYSTKINESISKTNTGGYGIIPNLPDDGIVSAARSGDGQGLILLDSNGKVYAYGDMPNRGNAKINKAAGRKATSITTTRSSGYIITANDGSVFAFNTTNRGGANKIGQLAGPIVDLAFTEGYDGYWELGKDGKIYNYGTAINSGSVIAPSEAGPTPISSNATSPVRNSGKPNIILVLVDDLKANIYEDPDRFPVFYNELIKKGTKFDNSYVVDSLCCPSRASLLRGQYPHNTNVIANVPPDGGLYKFNQQGLENSTIATWLKSSGYHTGFFGKYLNGYGDSVEMPDLKNTYVPPGWDEWMSPLGGPHTKINGQDRNPYKEYNYDMNHNGEISRYGRDKDDYLTDVLSRGAENFIATSDNKVPFFMLVAPYVPHMPATPADRYVDKFPNATLPKPPSFNTTSGDEPRWMKDVWAEAKNEYGISKFTPAQINVMEELYKKQLRSMLGVEDLISDIIAKLKETGELDNTYIIFTSDNGYHMGQHKLSPGKGTAYDTDTKVDLVVRGPGIAALKTDSSLVNNIDIAPTIAKLAGATVPSFVDGFSFADILLGKPDSSSRKDVLIEHLGAVAQAKVSTDKIDPDDDTIVASKSTAESILRAVPHDPNIFAPKMPFYRALRTPNYLYVDYYTTGEKQLFDVRIDPYQMNNLYNEASRSNPQLIKNLQQRLQYLSTCKDVFCRL